jgi:hypothetical protein
MMAATLSMYPVWKSGSISGRCLRMGARPRASHLALGWSPEHDCSSGFAGGAYSSAPDTPSPVYPDRLIRPLPKRPLRSRLSQEAADSILYPPAPPATQLFYGTYSENGSGSDGNGYMQRNSDSYGIDHSPSRGHRHLYENGVDFESGDEDGPVVVRRSAGFRGSSLSRGMNSQPYPGNVDGSQPKPPVSGPDGYDAFENTNNKKKRKIPTSGNLGSHHSSLTTDLANMGISSSTPASPADLGDGGGAGFYYGSGNSAAGPGSGISGPGRGRFGRSTARSGNGRNPLSAHTQSSWLNSRPGANRRDLAPTSLGLTGNHISFPISAMEITDSVLFR